MKKYSVVFAIVAMLSIFATALPASAQAEVVKNQFTFDDTTVIPAGELCDGAGDYNIIRREAEFKEVEVTDGKGRSHLNRKSRGSTTYENPATGEIYVASAKGNVNVNGNTTSIIVQTKLILPGPGNNYFSTVRIKTVTNANGEMVVDSFESNTECR